MADVTLNFTIEPGREPEGGQKMAIGDPYPRMPFATLVARGGHAFEDELSRECGMTPAQVRSHLADRVRSGELTRHDLKTGTLYTDQRETTGGRR